MHIISAEGIVLQLYIVGDLIFIAPELKSLMHCVNEFVMTFVVSGSLGVSIERILSNFVVSKP